MSEHPTTVEGFSGTPEELAERICALRYDELALHFARCASILIREANKDAAAGRGDLSVILTSCANLGSLTSMRVADAMRLSAKHMPEVSAEEVAEWEEKMRALVYWRKKEHS